MLLLTLMKIRLNLDWTDLAYRFGRSVQVAKDTFGITVFILKYCLSRVVSWPMQDYNFNNYSRRSGRKLYMFIVLKLILLLIVKIIKTLTKGYLFVYQQLNMRYILFLNRLLKNITTD